MQKIMSHVEAALIVDTSNHRYWEASYKTQPHKFKGTGLSRVSISAIRKSGSSHVLANVHYGDNPVPYVAVLEKCTHTEHASRPNMKGIFTGPENGVWEIAVWTGEAQRGKRGRVWFEICEPMYTPAEDITWNPDVDLMDLPV